MSWIASARGPIEELLRVEHHGGACEVRRRLDGFRLAYRDLQLDGLDRPLAEGIQAARTRGVWVLWMLRRRLSSLRFEPIREAWLQGRCEATEDLREISERIAGQSLQRFFDFWVFGCGLPDVRLTLADCRGREGRHEVRLRLNNPGNAYTVPLVVQTREGARHELSLFVDAMTDAQLRLFTQPVSASVDPEYEVLMPSGDRPWLPVRARRFGWF